MVFYTYKMINIFYNFFKTMVLIRNKKINIFYRRALVPMQLIQIFLWHKIPRYALGIYSGCLLNRDESFQPCTQK